MPKNAGVKNKYNNKCRRNTVRNKYNKYAGVGKKCQ